MQDRIRALNDNIEQRSVAIDKTNARLDAVLRDCDQVKAAVGSLDFQVGEFQRSNGQAVELQKRLFRQKDNEIIKNQDLDNGVRMGDQRVKDLDLLTDSLKRDLDSMR